MILALAACETTGGLRQSSDSPFAPSVSARSAESVDGLIVGHRLMAAGEYELALRAYYRAALDQGMTVDVLSAIGSANLKLGRLNQAEEMLRRATEKDETFVPAWNNLGVVLMEESKFGEAALVFRRAFALDSGATPAIRDNLARAESHLVDPDELLTTPALPVRLVRRGVSEYDLLTTPDEAPPPDTEPFP